MVNFYSSVGFLTVLSIDRHLAINLAMNRRARILRSTKNAWIASACIWCVAMAGVINILLYAEVQRCGCAIYFPGMVCNCICSSLWKYDSTFIFTLANGSPEDKYVELCLFYKHNHVHEAFCVVYVVYTYAPSFHFI